MTVHRLRLLPRPDQADRVRPALNGVPLADALTTEREGEPELAVRIRRARLHGMSADARRRNLPDGGWRYTVEEAGLKANMRGRHLYVVRVLEEEYGMGRDELIEQLGERGIGTSVHFIPLHHMPYVRRAAITPPGGLPGADTLFPELLSLPLHPFLTEREVDRICGEPARITPRRPAERGTLLSRTARPRAAWARRYSGGL